MAFRLASDYLNSGEVSRMRIADNITFDKANTPDAEDMFMRFSAGGQIAGHRVPDQDVHMDAFYSLDVVPPEAWTEYFSITTTHELTPDNGSAMFSADCFVIDNKDRTLWIRVLVDGTMIFETSTDLYKDSGNDHQQILISMGIVNTVPVGAVVTCELYGESDGIQMNGTWQQARFRLTASQSAPVVVDVNVDLDLGAGISRQEIDDALISIDAVRPRDNQQFYIHDNSDHVWLVVYLEKLNKFAVEKLTLK